MAAVETHAPAKRRARIAASYREPLRAAAWHPASWFFVGVCLLCAGYLVVAGYFGSLLIALGTLVGTAFFLLITIPLTSPVAAPPWPTPASTDAKTRRWLWAQVAVLVVLALLIYHWTLNGNALLPAGLSVIPLWTPFLGWTFHGVYSLLGSHMPAAFPLNNVAPIILLLLPGALLLLLGARPGELGFARGYRSWRVAAVWSSVPALLIAINLLPGAISPAALGWR